MADACSVCGVERSAPYTCNRAVCGHGRTFVFSFLREIGGEAVQHEFNVPANVHRRRIENELFKQMNVGG